MKELSPLQVNSLFSINGNPYDGKSFQGIQTIDHFYNWTLTKLIPGMVEIRKGMTSSFSSQVFESRGMMDILLGI